VLGGIAVIAIACHNPHVTQWVKAAAPGLFLPNAAEEAAKCYDTFDDDERQGSPEELRKNAERGDAAAQAALGTAYFWGQTAQGIVVGKDYTQAERWLRKAAEQGKTKAQSLLARLYAEGGDGVSQNWMEADFWVVLAMQREQAQQGNKGLPSCASLVLRKDVEGHLRPAQQGAVMQRAQKWSPVITPLRPEKTGPAPKPAATAAAPAAQPAVAAEADAGVCAGFAAGSQDRLVCEDQQKKVQRMKASQTERDKVYKHPAPKPGEAGDGKTADAAAEPPP
jgi:TPR repeat protein